MALSLLLQLRLLLFTTTSLERKMVSVERVLNYGELEVEPGYENEIKPPDGWPHRGEITLEDVSLTYYPGGPEVLHNLNAKIEAGEKVGVVGLTGAGKTSLTAAFSRMPDAQGKIFIDDIDINSINIQSAREALAVIPQIPFLFNGTLRQNLDPGHNFCDTQIWMVLEQVQLKDLLEKRLDKGDLLHLVVTENGANFSAGERQLICMARLLLRETKIIILDEATANIDYQTDQIIQNVIRNELQDQTVVTIAHRLDTVLDYDKIMVMDSGRIVEFDSPELLLKRKNSYFARMFFLAGYTKK